MMQLILRFFERATPRVENEAIAVSRQRAIFHEDALGNKTAVFESTTWSGNETAGPLMFEHNRTPQQQFLPEQQNQQRRMRRAVPYQQPVEEQRRQTAGLPLWPVRDDENW